MRVRTTQEELSREDIASLLFRHENEFMGRVMRLKRYYAGGHDILHKAARANNAPNNMIVANYCEYITSMNAHVAIVVSLEANPKISVIPRISMPDIIRMSTNTFPAMDVYRSLNMPPVT